MTFEFDSSTNTIYWNGRNSGIRWLSKESLGPLKADYRYGYKCEHTGIFKSNRPRSTNSDFVNSFDKLKINDNFDITNIDDEGKLIEEKENNELPRDNS
jgi:hypothetical protein